MGNPNDETRIHRKMVLDPIEVYRRVYSYGEHLLRLIRLHPLQDESRGKMSQGERSPSPHPGYHRFVTRFTLT